MTINITQLSKGQWGKVGKVALWLAVSAACAGALAFVTKNPKLLATLPGWNVLGVFVQGLLTTEESSALLNVPAQVKTEVNEVDPTLLPPTSSTPPESV